MRNFRTKFRINGINLLFLKITVIDGFEFAFTREMHYNSRIAKMKEIILMIIQIIEIAIILLITLILFERLMNIFFEKRHTSVYVIWGSLLLGSVVLSSTFIIEAYPYYVEPQGYSLFAYLIRLIIKFLLTFNYKSLMIRRVNVVCTAALFEVIYFGIHNFFTFEIGVIAMLIIDLPLYVILTFLARHVRIRKNVFDSKIPSLASLVVIFVIVPIMLFLEPRGEMSIDITTDAAHLSTVLLIFIVVGVVLSLLLLHYKTTSESLESKFQSVLYEKEKEFYLSQAQLMRESVIKANSTKHDMRLHLATLQAYIEKDKNKDSAEYLKSLLGEIEESELYSQTGNLAFDSIINYKLRNAKQDDIQLDLNLFVPQNLNIEIVCVVTILGNLLDNALEAVKKIDHRFIKLNIDFDKDALLIEMDNSFDGEVAYSNKKMEQGNLITLKSEEGHGLGLKNIQRMLDKYDGYMEITHTDEMFSVVVFLYSIRK